HLRPRRAEPGAALVSRAAGPPHSRPAAAASPRAAGPAHGLAAGAGAGRTMSGGRLFSPTLSAYIARHFAMWFFIVTTGMVAIIYIAETIELLRRASDKNVSMSVVLAMAVCKSPYMAQEILPFAMLAGAMATFWHLNRTHELTVARATGVSAWQFLLPAVLVALAIGVIRVTAVDPVTAALSQRFDVLEARYLDPESSLVTASRNGLWLRQPFEDGESVIHAVRISLDDQTFHSVSVLNFTAGDRFVSRIDAPSATLSDGSWRLAKAWVTQPNKPGVATGEYRLQTRLTLDQVVGSLAPSRTVSFWRLPGYISVLEATGFSALSHRMQWHKLLATPLLMVGMVLLAAAFALRPQRLGGILLLVGAGVTTGFLLYFLSDLIYRLGRNASIPLEMAAWTPAGLIALISITLLLYLEDG